MAERKMLFWIDFEATGLLDDPISPTMTEVAWTVTDPRGCQLVPLSQAFCALTLGPGKPHLPQLGEDTEGEPVGWWDSTSYPAKPVQEMHGKNGLDAELALMLETRPGRVLVDWSELERLVLDDLDDAGFFKLDRRQAQLAGAGVAHFEQRFLPELMPRVFSASGRMHYRTHDVSQVLSGLRTALKGIVDFPGTADHLIAALGPDSDEGKAPDRAGWSQISVRPGRYDAADQDDWAGPFFAGGSREPDWGSMAEDNHRAAPGIARALMAHRLLPEIHRLMVPA